MTLFPKIRLLCGIKKKKQSFGLLRMLNIFVQFPETSLTLKIPGVLRRLFVSVMQVSQIINVMQVSQIINGNLNLL